MKNFLNFAIFTILLLAFTDKASAQNILWDTGDWSFDAATASERNTQIPDAWIVDDVVFDQDAMITAYRWWSVLRIGFDPIAADFIVLNDSFEIVAELDDLAFSKEFVTEWQGRNVFRMDIEGLNVKLAPGHYYLGGRPVGEGDGRAFTGMNYTIGGKTEAYFRSAFFGFPDWTPASQTGGGMRDIAFTVFGTFSVPCLNLTVDNLVAGKNASFTITNGTPGARAVTVYGTQPGQTIINNLAGYCATFGIQNINQSKIIGGTNRIFGAAGKITLNQQVPQQAKGLTLLFQSAEQNTCPDECISNLVEMTVQ